MDKQTCRRPRGHGKHDGVGVGGAVKREIRVYPPARFSIVRSAAFALVSRWKSICRDESYRRQRRAAVMKIRQAFPRRTSAIHSIPSIVRAYTLDTHSSIELETIACSFLSERRGLRAPQNGFATDSFDTGCIFQGPAPQPRFNARENIILMHLADVVFAKKRE